MWGRIVKYACAAAGAVAGWFGGWSAALSVLLAAMCIDYLTGVMAAAAGRSDKTEHGGLSSKAGFIGIARKGIIMLIVLLATLLDRTLNNGAMVFQTAATCYYIANEGLSILENAARMNVPFPEGIKRALESMKNDNGESRE